jgi:hypothetical protein
MNKKKDKHELIREFLHVKLLIISLTLDKLDSLDDYDNEDNY